MIKTTKQIILDSRKPILVNGFLKACPLDMVWVSLESLKKEIDTIFTTWETNQITCNCKDCYAVKESLKDRDRLLEKLGLCNSQEQKTLKDSAVEKPLQMTGCSVSCEHNTGEDIQKVVSSRSLSVSSLVPDPNERYSDSSSRVKASGQESLKNSPANTPKKCTCKNTEKDKDDGLCIYCGGYYEVS